MDTFKKNIISLLFLITLSCTSNNSNSNNYSMEEAKKIIDSASKNIDDIVEDSIIYKGMKGFNQILAKKAENYVFKRLDIEISNNVIIETGFLPNDSSYLIQMIIPMSNETSTSKFYHFYSKSGVIIDGITFDTIFKPKKIE